MNIDHSYKESFFGTLPWMFMNILDLIPDGGKLEITGYPGGGISISEWCFPIDRNLGHETLERTFVDGKGETHHCHRDLYVNGYTDEWMNQLEQWINERFNMDSLDEEEDQIRLFNFTKEGDTVTFYDQVV